VRRRLERLSKRVNHMMSADPVLSEFVVSGRAPGLVAPRTDRGRPGR
jgi:hypothetical protein